MERATENDKVKTLEEENEGLRSNQAKEKAKLAALETEKNRLTGENDRIQTLEAENEELRQDQVRKMAEVEAFQAEHDRLKWEKAAESEKIQALSGEIEGLKVAMQKAKADEEEKEASASGPMPWETEEDLADLRPLEVLEVMSAEELTGAQRARLHELCVEEMRGELKEKTKEHVDLLDDYNSNKKALDWANIKLKVDEDKVKEAAAKVEGLEAELRKVGEEGAAMKDTDEVAKENGELKSRLQTVLVELASAKVSLERGGGEAVKRARALEKELEFERGERHRLKDRLRRMQSEKMDSTIAIPANMARGRSKARDLTSEMALQESTEEEQEQAKTTAAAAAAAATAELPKIDCADKAAYEKLVDSLKDAEWSCGSGVAKELALEAAQVRVTVLERRLAQAEEEREHFHAKAREYKARMVAEGQQQKQKQQAQVGRKGIYWGKCSKILVYTMQW